MVITDTEHAIAEALCGVKKIGKKKTHPVIYKPLSNWLSVYINKRKDASEMDHKTLWKIFQEIIVEFSEMGPTTLDELEKKVRDALGSLGECMIEWKLGNWDTEVRNEVCPDCGSKLENRKRKRQLVTVVADVTYKRYRSSCPNCGKVEYPLDVMLGLRSHQRLSWQLEELATLCGASWKYGEGEYILGKFLCRQVSHETIFNKTNEVGKVASMEMEGVQIKELEEDNKGFANGKRR